MLDRVVQRATLRGYSAATVTAPRELDGVAPRVSVVVPCYNYGRYLPECVGSVLSQPGVEVDVLVVDDASTDDSAAVAHRLAETDPRVRVIVNDPNKGHIATYNTGFAQVTGDYVLLLSADDALTPGALGRAAALLEANPGVGFAYGWSIPFSGDTLPPARTRTRSWSVWHGRDWVSDRCRRGSNVIRSSDALVRRSVLEAVGGYREDLPHSGDFEWWLRAALVADVGMVCGVDQMYYRLHGENMSRVHYGSALANLHETKKAFDAALVGEDTDGLRRSAYRTLSRRSLELAIEAFMSDAEDTAVIDGYRQFALLVNPAAEELPQWRALRRRETVGAARARRSLRFRGRETARTVEAKLHWRRWRYSGI
jgi:glycosyltransferase involved in cell wall biosynthesis